MKIENLILKLEEGFDDLSVKLQPDTDFKQLDEWSSLHALIIIALVDTEYDITLDGNDLRNLNTVQDLFDLIIEKKH
jgi:acyl carrier protein